jgi:DNA-binding response OmpR family regulator
LEERVRILLVEDEDRIASFVVKGLSAEGHSVERATGAGEASEMALSRDFDLILLDLLLPDGHGRDVLSRVRASKPELPVIVLSVLDLGADDYLTKPFSMRELSARIRASVRHGAAASHIISVSDLTLDTRTRIATRGDRAADLPSREFALLEYLMRHAGQVVTRQQLLDAVWGFDFDTGSNVVDVYVGYLRRKLDGPEQASVIETVRGAGYRVPS